MRGLLRDMCWRCTGLLQNYFPTCVGRAGKNNKNTQAASLGPAVYEADGKNSDVFIFFVTHRAKAEKVP